MTDAPPQTITDVVSDFLSSAPSLDEIANYRLPPMLQERVQLLLEKNRQGSLSVEDRAEIETFRQIDHRLTLMKAKASPSCLIR